MKVILAWTDAPGSPAAAKALVNDLDLVVDTPDGRRFFGNQGFEGGFTATAASDGDQRVQGTASLEGQASVAEPGQTPTPLARRMLILYGLPGAPTNDQRYQVRTDESGRFRFPSLMPGPYMLTDAVGGPRNWRLRVEMAPGQSLEPVMNAG